LWNYLARVPKNPAEFIKNSASVIPALLYFLFCSNVRGQGNGPLQPRNLLLSRTHPLCVGAILREFGVDQTTIELVKAVVFSVAALANFLTW